MIMVRACPPRLWSIQLSVSHVGPRERGAYRFLASSTVEFPGTNDYSAVDLCSEQPTSGEFEDRYTDADQVNEVLNVDDWLSVAVVLQRVNGTRKLTVRMGRGWARAPSSLSVSGSVDKPCRRGVG
jgi:hypothetical protein